MCHFILNYYDCYIHFVYGEYKHRSIFPYSTEIKIEIIYKFRDLTCKQFLLGLKIWMFHTLPILYNIFMHNTKSFPVDTSLVDDIIIRLFVHTYKTGLYMIVDQVYSVIVPTFLGDSIYIIYYKPWDCKGRLVWFYLTVCYSTRTLLNSYQRVWVCGDYTLYFCDLAWNWHRGTNVHKFYKYLQDINTQTRWHVNPSVGLVILQRLSTNIKWTTYQRYFHKLYTGW